MFKRKKKRVYTAKNGRKKACIQLKTTKDRYVFNNTAVFKRKKACTQPKTTKDGYVFNNTAVFKQKKESVYTAKNYQRQICFQQHSCV